MSPSKNILWLPVQPLSSIAAELSPLKYQIKTLVVSAQATLLCRDGIISVRASAKIPLKSEFNYECDVVLGEAGAFQFLRFSESQGDGRRVAVAEDRGRLVDDKQLIEVSPSLQTVVTLAQSPYVLRGAGDFSEAYLGLLVGRSPQLVRFSRVRGGLYKIAALGIKPGVDVSEPSRLDWKRAHEAEIKVSGGWIDEICVTIPLVGAITINRM